MECLVGQINTEIVNHQIPVLLENAHQSIKDLHTADLEKDGKNLLLLTHELLIISAMLRFVAEQRLEELLRDKEKYAPHPTYPQFPSGV